MQDTREQRHVYYDPDLEIEVYNLSGIVQKFPNHFHDYYVIGFVEGGRRHLWCRNREYDLSAGDLILFNPRDNHCCAPMDGTLLDYRAVNIKSEIMARAAAEIAGKDYLPHFTVNVVFQSDITRSLSELYDAVLCRAPGFQKEEALFFLLEQVLQEYSEPFDETALTEPNRQIQTVCSYLENHFSENISLEDLVSMTDFGKSYLLRSFTKQIGISPHRYLQTVRLKESRRFLEQGLPPVEAADMAGFSDQSHFTNFFKEFTGLTPRQYQRIFMTDSHQTSDQTAD